MRLLKHEHEHFQLRYQGCGNGMYIEAFVNEKNMLHATLHEKHLKKSRPLSRWPEYRVRCQE